MQAILKKETLPFPFHHLFEYSRSCVALDQPFASSEHRHKVGGLTNYGNKSQWLRCFSALSVEKSPQYCAGEDEFSEMC